MDHPMSELVLTKIVQQSPRCRRDLPLPREVVRRYLSLATYHRFTTLAPSGLRSPAGRHERSLLAWAAIQLRNPLLIAAASNN